MDAAYDSGEALYDEDYSPETDGWWFYVQQQQHQQQEPKMYPMLTEGPFTLNEPPFFLSSGYQWNQQQHQPLRVTIVPPSPVIKGSERTPEPMSLMDEFSDDAITFPNPQHHHHDIQLRDNTIAAAAAAKDVPELSRSISTINSINYTSITAAEQHDGSFSSVELDVLCAMTDSLSLMYQQQQQQLLPLPFLQQQQKEALERQFIKIAGPGIAELLLPHEDKCIIIETDIGLRITSCWRAERLGHSPASLECQHIDFLLTSKCRERVFKVGRSSSYEESILFCGDIIFVETAPGVRKWMSLWVKEKMNSKRECNGYTFIFVDSCEVVGSFTINKKGLISKVNQSVNCTKYDIEDFMKYPEHLVKGMPYQKAILAPELDKPFTTFQGLHYFITQVAGPAKSATSTLDVVIIPFITGMVSVSWYKNIVWSSETVSCCLFGQSPEDVLYRPVADHLPQFPALIDECHLFEATMEDDVNDTITICKDGGGGDDDAAGNTITSTTTRSCTGRSNCCSKSSLGPILHGITLTHKHCYELALKGGAWGEDAATTTVFDTDNAADMTRQHRFTARRYYNNSSSNDDDNVKAKAKEEEYAIELLVQHSFDKTVPHWVFVKYTHVPKYSTSLEDYNIMTNHIGHGSYGTAYAAINKRTDKLVTIKYVDKLRVLRERGQKKTLPMEIKVLKRLQQHGHRNCCEMFTYFDDKINYYIVMGNYGKTLYSFIEENPDLDEPSTRRIFAQIAAAVHHLHTDLQVIHRDIKDENITIDHEHRIRLIDFGSAAFIKKKKKNIDDEDDGSTLFSTFVGTIDYASPEVLHGNKYTGPPQDIWALGVLLYTIVYHSNPFHSPEDIIQRNLRFPFQLPDNLRELIERMLDLDVNSRFTIQQVVDHGWLHSTLRYK